VATDFLGFFFGAIVGTAIGWDSLASGMGGLVVAEGALELWAGSRERS
jgi:hypothetical protein